MHRMIRIGFTVVWAVWLILSTAPLGAATAPATKANARVVAVASPAL